MIMMISPANMEIRQEQWWLKHWNRAKWGCDPHISGQISIDLKEQKHRTSIVSESKCWGVPAIILSKYFSGFPIWRWNQKPYKAAQLYFNICLIKINEHPQCTLW